MLSSPLSFRGRAFLGLAALALSLFLATALPAEAPKSEQTLTLGEETQEQPIQAGEAHPWRLLVAPSTSVLVTIDQRSIGLVAEVREPGNEKPVLFGAGNDLWGPVVLLLETAGDYRITVRLRERGSWPGRYTLRAEAVPSTDVRHEALALMSRAGREAGQDTSESRKKAAATYRKALARWHDLGETAWEAEALTCVAMWESSVSDYKAATGDLQAALELWQGLGKRERQAETLNWLAVVYLNTQGPGKAREPWERSRGLWSDLKERLEEAQIENNLCSIERYTGSLPKALDCYQESAAFFHEQGAAAQEAASLSFMGGIHDEQGEPDEALAFYQKALGLWQPLGNHEKEAGVLNNIGKVHRTLGDWQEALRFYDLARKALSGVDDPDLAGSVLNNIGFLYIFLGEPPRARKYLENTQKLEHQAGDRSSEFYALNNLGVVWRNLGDREKALEYHRRAFEMAPLPQLQAVSQLGMAEVHLDRGDSAAALGELDKALQILGDKDTRRIHAQVLQLRGKALTLAGRAPEALPALREALSRRRELRDPAGEAETLDALVLAERSLGHDADALAHAQAAVDIVEGLRSGLVGTEDLRASFLAARRQSFSLLIDLLMARHDDQAAFKVSERAHARSLLDVLSAGGGARASAPPGLLRQRSALLYQLSLKAGQRWKASGAKAEALGKEIDDLRSEIDNVDAEIGRSDPRFAELSAPRPVSPQEIADGLEPGTMLLECFLGEERGFLWTIERGRVRSFPLPARAKIERLARQVYREMSQEESGSAHPGQAAERLSQILLGPVWADRASGKAPPLQRLVVVPDGALALVPFAVLPVPDPGRSWKSPGALLPLLERAEVVSIPSATTLAAQRRLPKERARASQWAAVFGDPVYGADDPRVARRAAEERPAPGQTRGTKRAAGRGGNDRAASLSLPRLTASGGEARAIQALAPPGKVRLALGLDANREAVLHGNLRGFRVLHFATHALADTENPELSGLVLSQVDAEGRPREGFLGLSDVYDLDLDAGLVVLSGCRTALGKEVRGEGLMGLTRGFQYAGVPRVVASLWPVDDRSNAELMIRFYKAMWGDHPLAPAAALREAQRELRKDPRYRDPHSWAAFVFQGDWR